MLDDPNVLHAMIALRLLATVLAAAIFFGWFDSLWRALRFRADGDDAARAILVAIAGSVLLFQARWLYPGFSDHLRLRIWLAAQAAICASLMSAIYYHGRRDDRFRLGRTILTHVAMLGLCIVFTVFAR